MAAEAKAASGLAGLADAALEEQFVHRVYDAIAPHFSFTRFSQWPRVRAFLEALPRGALVCDVGCGACARARPLACKSSWRTRIG
jgi:ubiquinone/menaquinone biosynthesis C-methylase UbiE